MLGCCAPTEPSSKQSGACTDGVVWIAHANGPKAVYAFVLRAHRVEELPSEIAQGHNRLVTRWARLRQYERRLVCVEGFAAFSKALRAQTSCAIYAAPPLWD